MQAEEFGALVDLHHGIWSEDLLGDMFLNTINKILDRKERIILGLKVQYYADGYKEKEANADIARLLKVREATVKRCIYDIKFKLRNRIDRRVDNTLQPQFYYAKKRKVLNGYKRKG